MQNFLWFNRFCLTPALSSQLKSTKGQKACLEKVGPLIVTFRKKTFSLPYFHEKMTITKDIYVDV